MNIIIDGKAIAQEIESSVADRIKLLDIKPGLAVILVGENPASQIYVRNKKKKAENLGIESYDVMLSENISQEELIKNIDQLNNNLNIHGILLQLPLPKHLNSFEAISAISPRKDVDGFNPENVGLLNIGQPRFVPCTPKGCVKLIKAVKQNLSGMNALIIGRSNVVGSPLAKLLMNENCTVTVAHSHTKNLSDFTKNADIIVIAAGCPGLVKPEMITPNKSIIIDVGINRYIDESGQSKIRGDIDFENLKNISIAITPVPGGVGPMTIACLMENVIIACELI